MVDSLISKAFGKASFNENDGRLIGINFHNPIRHVTNDGFLITVDKTKGLYITPKKYPGEVYLQISYQALMPSLSSHTSSRFDDPFPAHTNYHGGGRNVTRQTMIDLEHNVKSTFRTIGDLRYFLQSYHISPRVLKGNFRSDNEEAKRYGSRLRDTAVSLGASQLI